MPGAAAIMLAPALLAALLHAGPPHAVRPRAPRPIARHARVALCAAGRGPELLTIDLGDEGEPKGLTRISFTPMLPRSELLQMDLRLPLGMIIEVENAGSGSIAGRWYQKTRVVVTDALPGYSAYRNVRKGDLLRAVTAYRTVVVAPEGFNVWKQLTSYTPVGNPEMRRLIFRCEGAGYDDVREAIRSHAEGNSVATLVIERPLDGGEALEDGGEALADGGEALAHGGEALADGGEALEDGGEALADDAEPCESGSAA